MDLNGKIIVITGAARGLGAAMATRLAPTTPAWRWWTCTRVT